MLITDGNSIVYDKLCICSGSVPKLIEQNPNIIGIRDIDSVTDMCDRLSNYSTVAVVGNGGIALEVVNEVIFFNQFMILIISS
jgi:NAD(P)H-nitrite reductase large subunit